MMIPTTNQVFQKTIKVTNEIIAPAKINPFTQATGKMIPIRLNPAARKTTKHNPAKMKIIALIAGPSPNNQDRFQKSPKIGGF